MNSTAIPSSLAVAGGREIARAISCALFISALFYAPLAFGASTQGTKIVLDLILLFAALTGLFSIRDFRLKAQRLLLLFLSFGCIALQAVIALLNPSHRFDPELYSFSPVAAAVRWLPGTFDRATSLPVTVHYLTLLLAIAVLSMLCRSERIRWRFLRAIAISGFAVALTGIAQKLTDASAPLWVDATYHDHQKTFFAAFRYHGHAAAFLNLCWPAALALFVRSLSKAKNFATRALWGNALLFIIAALLFNTSKFGHLTLLGVIPACLWILKRYLSSFLPPAADRKKLLIGSAAIIVVLGVLLLPVAHRSLHNWAWELEHHGSLGGRLTTYRICIDMIASCGPFGFGPGTFQLLFPYYSTTYAGESSGVWIHAHQDYLQTLIEWGWLGALPWFAIYAGAVVRPLRNHFKNTGTERRPMPLSLAISLIAVTFPAVHALIDFPFQIGAVSLYAAIYLSILWAGTRRRTPQKKARPGNRERASSSRTRSSKRRQSAHFAAGTTSV